MAMQDFSGIGLAIVSLAIIVVIGTVVVQRLGDAGATCPTGYTANASDRCQNGTDVGYVDAFGTNASATFAISELGSSGLLGWVPAIVAMVIGMVFLGYFLGGRRGVA